MGSKYVTSASGTFQGSNYFGRSEGQNSTPNAKYIFPTIKIVLTCPVPLRIQFSNISTSSPVAQLFPK